LIKQKVYPVGNFVLLRAKELLKEAKRKVEILIEK